MGVGIRIWVLVVCSNFLVIAAQTDSNDFAVLNALKSSWRNLPPNWRGSNDPCGSGWEGINCTNSRVTSLILAGMGVTSRDIGDIPSLLALQYLDLSNNKGLRAPLPQSLGDLKNLTTLILVGCSFYGSIPPSIGSLPQLVFLGLNNNSLSGSIPPSLGSLSALSWLDLSNNQLTGSIPVSNETMPNGLDMLHNARHFHFSMNRLSGPIPPQLFSVDMSLIHLFLDNNELSGNIPDSLGRVGTLQVVRLDRNSFVGSIPQAINNLENVTELNLSNNNLTGLIPNLTTMNTLSYVDMSNNSFNASAFPSWITNLQSLTTIIMENTQIQGEIPSDLFSLPLLEKVVLSNNRLNGTLDIGNSYSSNLILDLRNNSVASFTQNGTYSMNLTLLNNPICRETGVAARYCTSPRPNTPIIPRFSGCNPVSCGADKVQSPTCNCAYPYTGTISFYSFSFSNLENVTYFNSLNGSLMSAFLARRLPVDSVLATEPIINVYSYLQFKLQIFPSFEERFNRTGVSFISSMLTRQLFPLGEYFGPYYFLEQNYDFTGKKKKSNVGLIVGATIGSSVAVVLLVCAGLYAFRQKKRAEIAMKQSAPFASWDSNNGSGGVPQLQGARWFSFEEIKKCTNNLSEENIIGSGGYGQVYKGTIAIGQLVAIKRAQQGSLQGAHEFKTEIELLSRIHHKNVVSLVGFCYEQGEQMLVYEYISNGTLKDNLSGKLGMKLNWMRRLKAALDSARGLSYLHELADPPIIHRDVKSTNILLDGNLNAKVADFGLSKLLGDSGKGYVTTQVKGTLGYMDPEYYMTQQLTDKSDVYSFGVVLLELITARAPIHQGKYIVREVKEAMDKSEIGYGLHGILDPNLGSAPSLVGLDRFVDLAMSCVRDSAIERPAMGEVVKEIESIIQLAVTKLNPDSLSTFSSNEGKNERNLYEPYDDESGFDYSSVSVPFETELR